MSGIGEKERRTQRRVARLFVDELGYEHLGDRTLLVKQGMIQELLNGKTRPSAICWECG